LGIGTLTIRIDAVNRTFADVGHNRYITKADLILASIWDWGIGNRDWGLGTGDWELGTGDTSCDFSVSMWFKLI
jgi:hypothetical protein